MCVKQQNRMVDVIAEVELLLGTDNGYNIARRLGYAHRGSLSRALQRQGRRDLASKIDTDDWAQLVGVR